MDKKMSRVFSLLQLVAAGIALVGTYVAGCVVMEGVAAYQGQWNEYLQPNADYRFAAVWCMAAVAVVSLASYSALWQFFTMCERLKHGTAFTTANERSMGCIALSCAVASGVLLATFAVLVFFCPPIPLAVTELCLLGFAAYGAVALVAYALQLLVRRAAALQQESDLTV